MTSKKARQARAKRQLAAERRYDEHFEKQDAENQREWERWKTRVTRELSSR